MTGDIAYVRNQRCM